MVPAPASALAASRGSLASPGAPPRPRPRRDRRRRFPGARSPFAPSEGFASPLLWLSWGCCAWCGRVSRFWFSSILSPESGGASPGAHPPGPRDAPSPSGISFVASTYAGIRAASTFLEHLHLLRLEPEHVPHRSKRATVDGAGAPFAERRHVVRGGVSLVPGEAVARVFL